MACDRILSFKGRDDSRTMLELEVMMTTDEFFIRNESESAKVLAKECSMYIYDAFLYVKVEVDSPDTKLGARLMRRICRLVELNPLVDLEDIDECGYKYSIQDTKKSRSTRMLPHEISRLTKIIESATDSGAFVFIRLYQETPYIKTGDYGLKMKFANIATKDVKIDTKQLMRVLNEIFSHQCVGFCFKFE